MDFHGMKRKELQKLCKKHGVPANLTNREMADRLASIYKENEVPVSLEKLSTNPEEIGSENEAKVVKKHAKKVRFSHENRTIEYEVSVYGRPRRRSRKQLLSKNPAQAIENAPNSEDIRKVVDCQVRFTRSRVQNAVEDVNMVFSSPVGRKRRRGGMKNRDAEVNNIGKSEVLETSERQDVKNGHDKVTGGLSGRQLRSRKIVTQEESKIRKGKGGDEVHLFNKISEESDVVHEEAKSKNGRKQPTRNARKEDQPVTLSSEVEKVGVVYRVTRQSWAQPKDIATMVKSEVQTVGVQGVCEEVLQLKEPQKGRGKNALRQNAVPQRVSAESSLIAVGGAAAEKLLRRSKRNAEKDCAKSATSVKSETQVTKVQEQSERDIALEEPAECLRRYSCRRKSDVPQSGKGGNKEEFSKKETKKRSRTTELDAIVEHSSEIERAKCSYTLQDQVPFRRSRRKIVILNPPALIDAELANKDDIDKMQQLRASYLEKDVTEELPIKSSQNSSRYSLSGTSKEDQIAVAKKDQGVKQQMQEPSLEEGKISVVEHHPITEKPQRRSSRITSVSASIAPRNPTAKVVEKRQPSKSRMGIIEEEAALTESLPDPGELPAGKDELVVAEGSVNKNDIDLNFSKQAVKNADRCSNKKRKELRGNSGAKKQCGFMEVSPLFLDVEECKCSAGNMEETLITTSEKLVGLSTDQEMQQSAHKSMVVEEKENNLLGDNRERLVHGGNVESKVNCMLSQSVNTTCVLDDANCSGPKLLEFESNVSHVVGSSEINFPAECQGHEIFDQEMKEDMKPLDIHSAHESLVVDKEGRSLVKNDKQRLVQVDSTDNEMNHPQSSWSLNGRGAVDDSNLLESREVEFGSNVINMDPSEITSLSNALSLADQGDLKGATSTLLNSEKELETGLTWGENINFVSDNVNADDSRTPFGEVHILVELKGTNVTAAESIREAVFKDPLNEFGETSGLKSGLENTLKKAEEMIATDFLNREGIPHMESSVKANENQESSAEFHFATAETGAQKIIEIQQSSCSNTAAPETPCGPAPGNQFIDKTCRAEVADTAGRGMCDQERSEDLNPGNAHFIHESVLIYEENTVVVKNNKEIRIHDDTSEGEMKYRSCLSLNGTGAIDDYNLVEPRMVDFESNGSKVVSPEITSVANIFSSASQADLVVELEKVLETGESSENMNSIYYNRDAEGSRTPIEEDQIKVQLKDVNVTAADSIGEVIFNDLLNELGESIGLKRASEIPLKKSEKLGATKFSGGEGIALTESSVKATEKHEYRAQTDIVTAITGTPNVTEMKWSSSSDTATSEALFRSVPQSQDKLCNAGITVSIAGSEVCNQDEETNLVEDDKEILIQDHTIEGEIKYQPCLSLNKTGALDDAFVEPRMVEFESNANKVICSEMTSLADVCSSASQANFAGETSNELKLEKVLESEESPRRENANKVICSEMTSLADVCSSASQANFAGETSNKLKLEKVLESEESPRRENVNYGSDKIEVEYDKSPAQEDQNSMHLEDANTIAAESVQEVVSWDHLNELCKSCGTKELEVSLKKAKETSTDDSSGEGMVQTESSVGINEKGEATAKIHTLTAETGEKTIMGMQWSVSSHDTTLISPLRPEVGSQDVQGALVDALVEPKMVEFQSDANQVICSEITSLADVCSSASQANFAGETPNELKLENVLESEESPRSENINYGSDKIEVEYDKSPAQEDQNSMHLEDANIIAVESVQEVVSWDHLNELCESCGTKELEVSLKKAEETSTDDSSGKGMVQTESSIDINEKSEATAKIRTLTAETSEKTIMEMQWSVSSHDTTLISPLIPEVGSQNVQGTIYRLETAVSNAGYGMCGHQKNEENVKIVENEHDETINTEKELFFSGKKFIDESFEGKFLVDGVCHRLSDNTDGQCAKDKKVDVSDGSFNNVSCETEEKNFCEVLDEGTDPVSSEEKDTDIFESASHADVSPQCICNEKLFFNGCLPLSSDMQEKYEAVRMDNKNMRNEIRAYFLPQLALEQLDNEIESEAAKQGAENGEVNARAICNATQALPSEELTAPIVSEPFSMRPHYHALVDGERNSSVERVMDHAFNKNFAATMDSNGISASRETDVGQDDNIMEEIAISSLKVVLADHNGCKVVSTEFSEEISNASVGTGLPFAKANYGDLDDQAEEVALQRDCSSSIGLDGLKSTVGIIVDNISKVDTLENTLNSNDPQSGTKVDDPDVSDSNAVNEFDAAFTVEEAGLEDGGKAPVSHQRSLHGGKQEDVPSYADKPCSKPEISIGSSTLLCSSIPVSCEKELHPQVMNDINDVGGTEISIDCKVTRKERDGCQINTRGFSDVTDGSLLVGSKGDLEEIAEAKSDDCEGSVKAATFMDSTNSLVMNQPPCLDENKNCDLETEEPHGLHLHNKIAGDSREVGSCNKLDIVSSMKPKMVIDCSVSSICATSDEHKDLESPDESHILVNMEMSLFSGVEDEVKKSDANAGDSNHSALDKTTSECNSGNLKKEDYVANSDVEVINFSVKKDGPEDIEETMELRKDVSGLVAAMADKSPLLKNSEVGRVVDHEEAFRSEPNFLSSQKKNVSAKKEGSNSATVKQLSSSKMKSKSKSSLIQRTPKRLIKHDMKENEPSTKREQIGNRTTPKTSSKRPPLEPVWKY